MTKAEFITMGCRLNIQETQEIKYCLKKANIDQEMVVINSCCVTKEALRQTRQIIRKAKRKYPHKKIIVTGCAAHLYPTELKEKTPVDIIVDNTHKLSAQAYITKPESQDVLITTQEDAYETSSHMLEQFGNYTRAFIKIQNGCDHRCTFCIIPFARGDSRSVCYRKIIQQIQVLCENGYKEFILTGVDITAYGNDLDESITLGGLVQKILSEVPALKRLRLSSVDCAEIPYDLIECISEERFMPHLHLSLQSGDNMILKRMKRRHSRENVIEFCHKLRTIRSDIVLGADIIAGFPTENEQHFNNTMNLIDECNISLLHVFPFSAQNNTPAARMPQNEKTIIRERARLLREKGTQKRHELFSKIIGTKQEVLIEKNSFGLTPHYLPVSCNTDTQIGSMVILQITNIVDNQLIGQPIYNEKNCQGFHGNKIKGSHIYV